MPDLTIIEPEAISPDLIPTIEDILAQARAGEISSVAIAFVTREGGIGHSWSSPPSFGSLLGAVARLAHRMNTGKDGE